MVRFLSEDFLAEAERALSGHDGFRTAIAGVDLSVRFEVSDVPRAGDVAYTLAISDGEAAISSGEGGEADVTVSNDYPTAVGISTGDLNTQMAFFTGKIKVAGNMGALLSHQAVLGEFADALSTIAVEY